ncbi:Glucose-repressible gene protein [Cladobotryum mycophilum]|uniref:Glucose-repressible gene protein n=1 Tax=Cladobotryum mycophilum TaxID=491253 RepID=A0ABR0STG8_9HYPO
METAKQVYNYAAETVQGAVAGASKETNKEIAKNDNASVGTRLTAAKDAVGDSINETAHNGKADAHKNLAQNS